MKNFTPFQMKLVNALSVNLLTNMLGLGWWELDDEELKKSLEKEGVKWNKFL